ncbi:MAG: TonB-dependent receptor [Bacteroidales bacterium]
MILKKTPLIILLILMLPQGVALGEEKTAEKQSDDTIRLDEVAVSVLPFKQSYQESAGGLFLVRPQTVDLQHMVNNTGLFNLVPGVYMATGTYNTNRLVIRGVGSRTPYNTNRIRAYLDDIPLTSGDGISTLEDQDISGIGTLEILKGPASSLYGSGLGGVVRLVSPYPQTDGFKAILSGEAASFGTTIFGLKASYKNSKLALTGGLTNTASDGYRENSAYGRSNAFMNLKLFGVYNTLSFTLSLVDLSARIPSSLNETDYIHEPSKAGGSWGSMQGFEEYTRILGGLSLESKLGRYTSNKLALFTTYSDPYESRPFNIIDDRSVNVGFRELIIYDRSTWKYNLGMEYFHEWVDWKVFESNEGKQGSLLGDQDEIRKNFNAFAMVQWRPGEKLLLDGGLNLNLLSYSLETSYRSDSTDQSGQYNYRPVVSPRIGLSYLHHGHHYLYGSAGHGFSAPSLEETLLPQGAINTELLPETGWNFELGNRGHFLQGRISYDVTIYLVLLEDLLVTERISEEIFTGSNAGKALNTGVELWGDFTIVEALEPKSFQLNAILSYTFSNNRFTDFVDDGVDYTGNVLPGIPAQILNTILSAKWRPLDVKLRYQYQGRQWVDDLNSKEYGGHQLLHLQAGWKIQIPGDLFSIRIHGGISNIFNLLYSSMILVNAPSFGGSEPRYYYPGNPREYHLGATLYFK